MADTNCIFCKIIAKEVPSYIVDETEKTISFLDIGPFNPGHTLVCPKDHYEKITDVPDDVAGELIATSKRVAKLLQDKLGYKGFNLLQNNDRSAGQLVGHVHIHVIPRNENDKVNFHWGENVKKQTKEQLEEVYNRLVGR